MTILFYISLGLFMLVSLILTLLVLIQKGRGGGLSGAFGGGGGGSAAFGAKTGDVLTWATSVVFGIFIVLAVTTNLIANHMGQTRSSLVAPAAPLNGAAPVNGAAPGSAAGGTEAPANPTPAAPAK